MAALFLASPEPCGGPLRVLRADGVLRVRPTGGHPTSLSTVFRAAPVSTPVGRVPRPATPAAGERALPATPFPDARFKDVRPFPSPAPSPPRRTGGGASRAG